MHPVRDSIRASRFSIRDISEHAAQLDDVIRLDIGQPDFATPDAVKQRAANAIQEDDITYTSLWGIDPLREEIAAYESDKMALNADNVMVTTGGTGALYCILNTLLDDGDTVLANDPAWPPYQMIAAAIPGSLQQTPYFSNNTLNTDGVRDAIDDSTAAIILNTPENPTGRVYTKQQLQELGSIAAEHDLYIIADEVYDRLIYDGEHVSIAELFPDRTLLVNSLSKTFAMTGWRVGWAAAQDTELIEELGKTNRATTACPNYVSQQAALAALQDATDYAAEMRQEYRQRRNLVEERVQELDWSCVTPQGTIYAFPDTGQDSWTLARTLLDEAGVAVVPGEPHGAHSDTNIRLCFGSASQDELRDGFDRIAGFMD